MAYKYCVAENWGEGFITNKDSRTIQPTEFAGNVWRVPANNKDANLWIVGVAGVNKTLSEAQTIVNEEISSQQTSWDNNNVEGETEVDKTTRLGERPETVTLEE